MARAQVGGKMAQVGSRLIDAAAGKIAEDFFTAFEAALQAGRRRGGGPGARAGRGRQQDACGGSSAAVVVVAAAIWFLRR